MTPPIMFDPGSNCSWCGHAWPHPHPCPGSITIAVRKGVPEQKQCPCQKAGRP